MREGPAGGGGVAGEVEAIRGRRGEGVVASLSGLAVRSHFAWGLVRL